MDTAPGDDSAQSDQEVGPSLPPPPCPGEGGGAAESCWARGEPEHQSIRIGRDSVLFGKKTKNKGGTGSSLDIKFCPCLYFRKVAKVR